MDYLLGQDRLLIVSALDPRLEGTANTLAQSLRVGPRIFANGFSAKIPSGFHYSSSSEGGSIILFSKLSEKGETKVAIAKKTKNATHSPPMLR